MDYRIYLSPPTQNGFEEEALVACLKGNWLAPVGPELNQFEKDLANLHLGKPVLALNSGTAAIHLALVLAGVGQGDTVIVATHTHNATVNPIIYQGATPIFVDVEPETWNISPEYLEKAILKALEAGNKPKAIIAVHLYGLAADMVSVMQIADKHGITVIEDAAESLGGTLIGKPLGTFGQFGILSFNGNKIVTSGGGGALICQDDTTYEKALFYATQARDAAPHFQHSEIGYNYRLSNVLATLGRAQLKNLTERVQKRRNIFSNYLAAFQKLNAQLGKEIVSINIEFDQVYSNRWLSTFLVRNHKEVSAETWRLTLLEHGIESRPLWKPMHQQPVFQHFPFYGNHTSDYLFAHGICLPSGTDLSLEQQQEIIQLIHSLY